MRHIPLLLGLLAATCLTGQAHAGCYADYKAKRENPLKLHYGVIEIDINPCTMSDKVKNSVAKKLSGGDWKLLQIQSVFEDDGLGKRKQDAGEYFLRF